MAGGDVGKSASTNGLRARSSRQFDAVTEELARSADFRSAQDIHAALRTRENPVGLATVYRALQTLVDHGLADVLQSSTGEAVYRECSRTHHHHLVCRHCGRAVEVNGPAFERWTERTARAHGYTDVSHTLELFGTCADCGNGAL
jgi:Fur family transcriptional regulator, ferric uptake regulator